MAERVVILTLALFPDLCAAGYIDSISPPDPYVGLSTGGFDMDGFYVVRIDSVVTSDAHESRSNHNGSAQIGPCSFGNAYTPLYINSGGWYGAISQPKGQASGSLDCRLKAELTVLDRLVGKGPPDAFFVFLNLGTYIRFDPASEIADYEWNLGVTLISLDTGRTRTYREPGGGHCGPDDDPINCSRFLDFARFYFTFPVAIGERVAADLLLNLRFDLRAIPEPSSIALLIIGLVVLLAVGKRARLKGPLPAMSSWRALG